MQVSSFWLQVKVPCRFGPFPQPCEAAFQGMIFVLVRFLMIPEALLCSPSYLNLVREMTDQWSDDSLESWQHLSQTSPSVALDLALTSPTAFSSSA